LGSGWSGAEDVDAITNGLTFGLNIVIPIGNVFRALLIGANVRQIACQNGAITPAESIFAYGGPILYLCIQVAVLLLVIIWIEGDLALFRRKQSKGVTSTAWTDSEKTTSLRTDEVEAERMRVEEADGDLLRMLGLHKSFGPNHAVQDVTLGLPPNDVMALLGPNGAGKSTLVNMIQSELSPDRGQILLQGEDSRTRSAQRYLGVCPQYDALDFMTTEKQLAFYARIKGIKDVKGNVNHIMARLDLAVHAKTRASKLSGGNKRKLSLAIALMGAPPVMVLDEPTSAMDAVAKRSFWKLVQDITPGRSVLLTTHSMEEADALATRAAIISSRLLAVGTTEALREKYSNVNYVQLQLSSAPNSSEAEMNFVHSWVQEKIPGAQLERLAMGGQVRFTIPGTDAQGQSPVPAVIELLEKEKDNIGVGYYSVGGATLERVFLSVVRGNDAQEEDGVARKGFLAQFWRR
jgi:ABC-type multidrug transport system ATPase subunit